MSKNERPPYNPHARQPRTLGELERWLYAADVGLRARMAPFPVALNPPPIPGLDRLSAYCRVKYGEKLSIDTVTRLIGEYVLVRDVSTEEAKEASLQDAADTLAPMPRPSAAPDTVSARSDTGVSAANPLHEIIEWMYQFRGALWQYHQAGTVPERDQAETAWRALTQPFWGTYRIPTEAFRCLADPALAWCHHKGFSAQEHVATIETATAFLISLATHSPCAEPSVYANEDQAQPIWERQGSLLLDAGRALDDLRRLAALTGAAWQWDRRLPWEANTQVSTPAPVDSGRPDRVLERASHRQDRLDQLQRSSERCEARTSRLVEALRHFAASSPSQRELYVDALLAVCQAARDGGFSEGMEEILSKDPDKAGDNHRLAIHLYRLGWAGERQAIVRYVDQLLNELPRESDHFDRGAASQYGVREAVRSLFDTIVPWPPMQAVHGWHPDAIEAGRLQAELAPRPCHQPESAPAHPIEGSKAEGPSLHVEGERDVPPQQAAEVRAPVPGRDPPPEIDLEAQALALLFQEPDWSVAQIADYLKVDRKTPYKWSKFRKAAELDGRLKPRGVKDRNPRRGHKTGDGHIEAYTDDGEDE